MIQNPASFPEKDFTIQGPAGTLVGIAGHPVDSEKSRKTVAIICHPHPLFGGTMNNKVTHMIEKSMRELNCHSIRFNFRGVEKSEGEFDDGKGETDDLMAIYHWIKEIMPEHKIFLAGFSFGSYVALRACPRIKPQQFLTVAPPVERYDFTELELPQCPWLVIQGEEDDVVTPKAVYDYVNNLENRPQLVTFKAGHFFHRRLLDLKGAIINGILRQLTDTAENPES